MAGAFALSANFSRWTSSIHHLDGFNIGWCYRLTHPTLVYDRKSYNQLPCQSKRENPQGERYNIKNEVVIGALLLPGGLGSAGTYSLYTGVYAGAGFHVDSHNSGGSPGRPNLRPCHRGMERKAKWTHGPRGPAACCAARGADSATTLGATLGSIHDLCPWDYGTPAQYDVPVREWNRGA